MNVRSANLSRMFREAASLDHNNSFDSRSIRSGGGEAERENDTDLSDDILYEQEIGVTVASADRDRDDRHLFLSIRVALHNESSRKIPSMQIDIVDPKNPLFLYALRINEPEFHTLKQRQDLLVDFGSFPEHLVYLLNQCVDSDLTPKYVARLTLHSLNSSGVLSILEPSRMRHLQHLELEFRAASDLDLKDYLSHQVKVYKTCARELRHELRELREKFSSSQTAFDALERMHAKTLTDADTTRKEMSATFAANLSREKESAILEQRAIEARADEDRRSLSSEHKQELNRLHTKLDSLQVENRGFSDQVMTLTHAERRAVQQVDSLRDELKQNTTELNQLRSQNNSLDSTSHSQEKQINGLKMSVTALQQQLKDREDLSIKNASLLDATKEQKMSLEDSLSMYKASNEKNERRMHECAKEIAKGNKIIQQLQSDLRNAKSKLKLKSSVIIQQENVLNKKQQDLDDAHRDVVSANSSVKSRELDVSQCNEQIQRLKGDLNESKEVIESNQKVIGLLNQEITEQQLRNARQAKSGTTGSSAYTFRPSPATDITQNTRANANWHPSPRISTYTPSTTKLSPDQAVPAATSSFHSPTSSSYSTYGSSLHTSTHPALASLRAKREALTNASSNTRVTPLPPMPSSSFFTDTTSNAK